jgi:hypothetical protein
MLFSFSLEWILATLLLFLESNDLLTAIAIQITAAILATISHSGPSLSSPCLRIHVSVRLALADVSSQQWIATSVP